MAAAKVAWMALAILLVGMWVGCVGTVNAQRAWSGPSIHDGLPSLDSVSVVSLFPVEYDKGMFKKKKKKNFFFLIFLHVI